MAGHAAHGRVVTAGEVANSGTLNLDDASAKIGEMACGKRRCDRLFQGNDGDSFERLHKSAAILLKYW